MVRRAVLSSVMASRATASKWSHSEHSHIRPIVVTVIVSAAHVAQRLVDNRVDHEVVIDAARRADARRQESGRGEGAKQGQRARVRLLWPPVARVRGCGRVAAVRGLRTLEVGRRIEEEARTW